MPAGWQARNGGHKRTSKSSALKNSSWPCMAFKPPSTRKRPWGDQAMQFTVLLGCELTSCTPCTRTGSSVYGSDTLTKLGCQARWAEPKGVAMQDLRSVKMSCWCDAACRGIVYCSALAEVLVRGLCICPKLVRQHGRLGAAGGHVESCTVCSWSMLVQWTQNHSRTGAPHACTKARPADCDHSPIKHFPQPPDTTS